MYHKTYNQQQTEHCYLLGGSALQGHESAFRMMSTVCLSQPLLMSQHLLTQMGDNDPPTMGYGFL
jgi:hypothetical protein